MPIQNPYTLGNAWFVDKVQYVNNANEEIESLHKVMPAKVAVVDKKFAEQVKPVAVSDSCLLYTSWIHSFILLGYKCYGNKCGIQ